LLFRYNNGRTNAPQYYVRRTLRVLLIPDVKDVVESATLTMHQRGRFMKMGNVNMETDQSLFGYQMMHN